MSGIKIPVSATLNTGDVNGQIKQIEAAFNALGKVAEKAGHFKFQPISGSSLQDVQRMQKAFESMQRLGAGLRKTLEGAGQGGKGFHQVDWDRVWTSEKQRAGHAATMVRMLDPSAIATSAPSEPTPSGAGRGAGNGDGRRNGGGKTPAWQSYVMGGAAGVAGGVASQVGGLTGGALSGALAGSRAGPIGAIAGGILGAGTSVLGGVGEARDLSIQIDTLKRALGDLGVSFDQLKESNRKLGHEYALTDEKSAELQDSYARIAGHQGDVDGLRDRVGVGVGFARSFGLDPAAGNQFFGHMAGLGITRNVQDDRRLAAMLAEAITKSGGSAKMAELAGAMQGYMERSSSANLSATGGEGFLGLLSGLKKTGLAGMTVDTASTMVGTWDASVRSGGNNEASQNWMFAVQNRERGLDPYNARIMNEGGLFATGASVFGEGSAYALAAHRNGEALPAAANDNRTNYELQMKAIRQEYAGRPIGMMLDAYTNVFGGTRQQAAAGLAMDDKVVGSIGHKLTASGIDLNKVNSTAWNTMGQIVQNDSLSEAEKSDLLKKVAGRNQETTEADEARRAQIASAKVLQHLADNLIPTLTSIQNAVLKWTGFDPMAEQRKKLTDLSINKIREVEAGPVGQAYREAQAEYEKITPFGPRATGWGMTDEQRFAKDRRDAAKADLDAELEKIKKHQEEVTKQLEGGASPDDVMPDGTGSTSSYGPFSDAQMARMAKADQKLGFEPGTTAAIAMTESSGQAGRVSKKGAQGYFQIMPQYIDAYGAPGRRDPNNFDHSIEMYEKMMQERNSIYGSDKDSVIRSYHGGYDPSQWGRENADYLPTIEKYKREIAAQQAQQAQRVDVHVTHDPLLITDANGNQIASPSVPTSTVRQAVSGAR